MHNRSNALGIVSSLALGLLAILATYTSGIVISTKPATASSDSAVTQGSAIETQKCASCHAGNSLDKRISNYSLAQFQRMLDKGVDQKGQQLMPPMGSVRLPADQAAQVYAYLKSPK
jgi:mono/diheme cytochrome c family protein